jgi:hypothetical protein
MTKIRLIATAAVAAGALFSAQAPVSAQTIGFKVGQTFSKLDVEGDDSPQDYLAKLGGGGFLRFGFGGLGMQAELLALTKGTKADAGDGVTEGSLRLDYIEVPVLARFGLGMNPMIAPYIMVGPSFAYNSGCSVGIANGDDDFSADCDDDSPVKKFDIGATGVAGLEFRAGPGNILVEGRYTHGLMNVNDDETTGNNEKIKNRSFAVMAGYAFTLR